MEFGNVQSAVCDVSLGSDGYGCWQHPFRGIQIRMHPLSVRHLSDEALRGIKAKPESEIGGLLWGRVLGDSVVVEDAQSIRSNGPLYNATPLDIRNLEQAIKRNRPDGLELVGYFRSHIRDGLCLSGQDQDLITKYLRNPEYLFLLIRPFEMGICVGAFFFWQNGQLQTDGSDLEVPFVALDHRPVIQNEVRTDDTARVKPTGAPEQSYDRIAPSAYVRAPAPLAPEHWIPEQPQQSAPPPRSTKRSWFPLIGFACLTAVAATAGTATYFAFPILKMQVLELIGPVVLNPEVGLKVARTSDGQLDLTWNRNALERARAHQALLTITDGPASKQLTIDDAQLRSGTLTYFPSGSDIQFRIEIPLNGGLSIAESVRVILPDAIVAAAPAILTAPSAMPKHAPEPEKPRIATLNHNSSGPSITARAPFRAPAFTAPAEVLNSSQRGAQPHAPELPSNVAAPTTYAALPLSVSALPAPPPHLNVRAPSTASARNVLTAKPPVSKPAAVPTSAAHTITAYVPPRPLRQVMPDVKVAGYALASQSGKVEVQVTIDEAGHVKDARPLHSGVSKTNGLLANAAVAAARQWIFQPAILHGKAVAAEHRIVFDFRHESQ